MATAPEVQIDRNVPFPRDPRGVAAKYPVTQMSVGDSFLHPGPMTSARSLTHAANARHRLGFKFTYAEENGRVRIWRRA